MKANEVSEWKPVGENLVRHAGGSDYPRTKVAGKVIRVKLDAADQKVAKLQRADELAAPRTAATQQATSGVRTTGEAIKVVP